MSNRAAQLERLTLKWATRVRLDSDVQPAALKAVCHTTLGITEHTPPQCRCKLTFYLPLKSNKNNLQELKEAVVDGI